MPSILAQTKAYHGEKVISSFEASRKRLLSPQEQEETARDDRERLSHPEKRARISAGENNFIPLCCDYFESLQVLDDATQLCFSSLADQLAHPLIKARSASNGEPL